MAMVITEDSNTIFILKHIPNFKCIGLAEQLQQPVLYLKTVTSGTEGEAEFL